jgi:hypothetical protein
LKFDLKKFKCVKKEMKIGKKKRQLCQTSSLLVEMEKGMEITCINKVLIYVFIK